MARFLVDNSVPDYLADFLSEQGNQVTKLRRIQLSQRAKDSIVIEEARRRQCIFLTCDNDYADPQKFPPSDYWGILILKIDREDRKERCSRVQRRLLQLLNQIQNLRGRAYRIARNQVKPLDVQAPKKHQRKKRRA